MKKLSYLLPLVLASGLVAQATKVLPAFNANNDGISWYVRPLGSTNMKFQQIYDNSELKDTGITFPNAINSIACRQEARFTGTFAAKTLDVVIRAGQTTVSTATMTNNFANNASSKLTTAFTGKLSLPAAGGGKAPWNLGGPLGKVTFTTPVPLLSNTENLLIEWENVGPGAGRTNTSSTYNVDRDFYRGVNYHATFHGVSCPTGKNGITINIQNIRPGGSLLQWMTAPSAANGQPFAWLVDASWQPLDLGPLLGALGKGCYLMLPAASFTALPGKVTPATTAGRWNEITLPIPNNNKLLGVDISMQPVCLDLTGTPVLGVGAAGTRRVGPAAGSGQKGAYMYFNASGTPPATGSGPFRGSAVVFILGTAN